MTYEKKDGLNYAKVYVLCGNSFLVTSTEFLTEREIKQRCWELDIYEDSDDDDFASVVFDVDDYDIEKFTNRMYNIDY